MFNWFGRFFARTEQRVANMDFAAPKFELGQASVVEPPTDGPCADCGGLFLLESLSSSWVIDVHVVEGEIVGVVNAIVLYCGHCKPDAPLQMRYVVSDLKKWGPARVANARDKEVEETRLFSVDAGLFQDIDHEGEVQWLTSIEQYTHGVCNGCAENTTEQEECAKCRRRSKK